MALEHSIHTNGLRPKSWGDIAAFVAILAPLITMLISTVFWGLKLETELNQLRESHQILAIEVGGGQLELVRSIDIQTRQDLSRLKRDVEEWQLLHDKNFPPQWLVDQVQHIDKQLDDHIKENSH
jgi:hypothetical protein